MKQTKLFFIMLLAVVMIGVTSCGSKDDDKIHSNASMLQGETWNFQKASMTFMGQTMDMSLREIKQAMAQEAGTSNVIMIDERLRFEAEHIVMVNTGDRYAYKYYSNGTLWIEGIDDIDGAEGVTIKLSVKSLTGSQLVIRYEISADGNTIPMDMYYTR